MITATLQPLKTARRAVEGRFLYIKSATGSFEIRATGIAPLEAVQGQYLELPADVHTIELRDSSGAVNDIQIENSVLRSERPESNQVQVTNPIAVSSMPDLNINHSHTVNVPEFQPANESPDTPDITILAGQTVLIHDPTQYSCDLVSFWAGELNLFNLRAWSGGDGTVVQGGLLAPGGSGSESGALKIWVHNPNATDQTVTLNKVKRVNV